MPEFLQRYGTEAQCQAALEATRWPAGFVCPACGGAARTSFDRGGLRYWQCGHCAHQCSLISGTVFEASKLPLTRWFLAMQLLTQSKNNVSALELRRHLGPLDIGVEGQLGAVFEAIDKRWGRLDILVHSIAFAPKEDLQGGLLNSQRGGAACPARRAGRYHGRRLHLRVSRNALRTAAVRRDAVCRRRREHHGLIRAGGSTAGQHRGRRAVLVGPEGATGSSGRAGSLAADPSGN
jgi:ribosomal protein L37AE/L43A